MYINRLRAGGTLTAFLFAHANLAGTETIGSYSVPEHHVTMFTSNVVHVIQKQGGILPPLVTRGSYRGEKVQVVNLIGTIEFTRRDVPYQDTQFSELEHKQRWISGYEQDAAVLIDRLDLLKMIYDPTSPYVEAIRNGAARARDAVIMSAFFADTKTGKNAATTTTYKAANTVVHGGTGLTVAKLRAMRKLIKKRHVDLRSISPYIAVTAEETDDLLGETAVQSIDYNVVRALVNGEVNSFMGFQFVPYEAWGGGLNGFGIPVHDDTGVVRELPVWVPQGMHFGEWDGLTIIISNRPDKNNIKQVHATFTIGATRIEEDNVFKIEAKE